MEGMANIKRYTLFILGILLLTLGVALTIKADLGTGAWDAVSVALNRHLGLSVGTFGLIMAIIFTLITGLLRGKRFNFYTLITALLLGIFIDFWLYIMGYIAFGDNPISRIGCFIIGIILLSLGIALYIGLELAPNSIDDFMVALSERFRIKISLSKLLVDGLGLIMALILRGPIGLGTFIITISLGPTVGFFHALIYEKIPERKSAIS